MNRNEIRKTVNAFPVKHKEGFSSAEIEELRSKHFPDITKKELGEKIGIVTGIIIGGECLIFHSDIELGLICASEKREPNTYEFD